MGVVSGFARKSAFFALLVCFVAGCAAESYYYPPPPPAPPPRLYPGDLRVTDLDMRPDPIVSGERPRFSVVIFNRSPVSGHVRVVILDRDELVAEAIGVLVRPGVNTVAFPRSSYRFHRSDHCFTVEVDIEGTRHPVDLARRFCARRTPAGWTLTP